MARVIAAVAAVAATALALTACGLPRDPEGTLERVRGGTLRIGVAEHEPWVVVSGDGFAGAEVALVEDMAARLDARIEWTEGTQGALLEALERRQLDLVIGGLTAEDPWAQRVAFTKPYMTVPTILGIEPGAPPPDAVDGLRVTAEAGTDVPALVEEHDGIPVPVESLEGARPPIAAEGWEVRGLGLQPTDVVLYEDRHVVAAVPGENAWIVYLERYLRSRRADIPSLLVEHAR